MFVLFYVDYFMLFSNKFYRFDVDLTVFAQSVGSTEIPSLSQTPITDITERFSLKEPKARFQEKIFFPIKRDCI